MVRKSTWILIVVLLGLVGLSLYLQKQKGSQSAETATPSSRLPLFSAETGQPSVVRIENAAGDAVELARDSGGKWVLRAPSASEADQAAAEAAATQVGALRSLSTVKLAPAVIGLDKPAYTLTISFNKAGTHQLRVGSQTPIQDGYYSQLDDGPYQVVDKSGLDVLIGLLKAPPYPATPTPGAPPASGPSPQTSPTAVVATDTPAPAPTAQ